MKWFIVFSIFVVVSTGLSANLSFDGGIIAGWGTNVALGGEVNFPLVEMLRVNAHLHYVYGSDSWRGHNQWGGYDISSTHHLVMPGIDISVYPVSGRFNSFNPYFDFGVGYTFAYLTYEAVVPSQDEYDLEDGSDSGAFFKLLFGSDFDVGSTITPYGEMGVWIFTGHDADADASFVLLAGLRF